MRDPYSRWLEGLLVEEMKTGISILDKFTSTTTYVDLLINSILGTLQLSLRQDNKMNYLKLLGMVALSLIVSACEVAKVTSVQDIKSEVPLDPLIQTPVQFPVVYYADSDEYERVYRGSQGLANWRFPTGKFFTEAIDVVLSDVFETSKKLTLSSDFAYIIMYESTPKYSNGFGTYSVELKTTVLDNSGEKVFSDVRTASVTTGGGTDHRGPFVNAYAKALTESAYSFLNSLGDAKITELNGVEHGTFKTDLDIRTIIGDVKPASTGSGFIINKDGQIYTANHVVDECLFIEVKHGSEKYDATLIANSLLLDLAVLDTDHPSELVPSIIMGDAPAVVLGSPVVATGFPLSNLLSDFPSMTMGNVSSLGGVKGAKGIFQFSAPVQPGSSGGPISDYNGNVLGLVSSSLNQRLMRSSTQNVNFGIGTPLLTQFLKNNNIQYSDAPKNSNFEATAKDVVDYTVQVLCYK